MPSLEITFAAQTPTTLRLLVAWGCREAATALLAGRWGESRCLLRIAEDARAVLGSGQDGLDDVSNPHGSPSEA